MTHTPMHSTTFSMTIVVFVALSAASLVGAQTLGDVARAEQARRQQVSSGKVYTNTSLPAAAPAVAPVAAAGDAQASQAGGASGAKPEGAGAGAKPDAAAAEGKEAKKDEAYWRKRLTALRDALERANSFAEALQSRINALSTDFVNRDDPAQRNVVAADRQKALTELERVRKEIQEHTKAIADLQQEGRRAGVPAGWLR